MTSLLDWKAKPIFPLAEAEEDIWFISGCEEKTEDGNFGSLTKGEIARKLLTDIENIGKTDDCDAFSNWLEEKINAPIFDEIQPVESSGKFDSEASDEVPDLGDALKDIDLTPPHSPGRERVEELLIFNLEEAQSILCPDGYDTDFDAKLIDDTMASIDCPPPSGYEGISQSTTSEAFYEENQMNPPPPSVYVLTDSFAENDFLATPLTPMSDLEKEVVVVGEVIRGATLSRQSNSDCCESEACSSASINSFGSLEGSGVEDESDASDWSPLPKITCKKPGRPGKRSRPCGRRERKQEDRTMRKKEQNKNAAVRYRLRKKAEMSEILEEEKALNEKKRKLEQRVSDVQIEIKYLKGLMRDLFRAKGLLIN